MIGLKGLTDLDLSFLVINDPDHDSCHSLLAESPNPKPSLRISGHTRDIVIKGL